MSPRTPRLTAVEVIKILKLHGFVEASQEGSHKKFFNPKTRRIAIVPFHKGKELPIGTLKSIEKQAGITF
jgi:predicted RNA binding protein YcfA (HicA-like mRNA interferase family)